MHWNYFPINGNKNDQKVPFIALVDSRGGRVAGNFFGVFT